MPRGPIYEKMLRGSYELLKIKKTYEDLRRNLGKMRFTKYIKKNLRETYDKSYEKLTAPYCYRRIRGDMIETYKTRCWHVTISCQPDGRPP